MEELNDTFDPDKIPDGQAPDDQYPDDESPDEQTPDDQSPDKVPGNGADVPKGLPVTSFNVKTLLGSWADAENESPDGPYASYFTPAAE
jgi:hypothetical protein